MARFGDFTLLEDLGASAVADRHRATHATLGGPFFLKILRRLPTWQHAELARRGDLLIGVSHPHLAPHLGHGVVEGTPFVVSPWLDGLDLHALVGSLKDRRVNLTLDQCLLILADVTKAIAAFHRLAPDGRHAHGDVSIRHVRVGLDGQVRLTGLCTPRGLEPGKPPDIRFDLAGVGAMLYDLVPLLRGGAARPPLPTALDRVIRRSLAIGPPSEHLTPIEFGERLEEVFSSLKLSTDKSEFLDVIQRTLRALEKKAAEARPRGPADGMPELIPVTKPGPILEPMPPRPAPWAGTAPPITAPPPPTPIAVPAPPTPWSAVPPPAFLTGSANRGPDPAFLTGSARSNPPPPVAPVVPPANRPSTLPQFAALQVPTEAPPRTPAPALASPFARPAPPPTPAPTPPAPPSPPPFLAALASPARPAGPIGVAAAAAAAFDPSASSPAPPAPFDSPSSPFAIAPPPTPTKRPLLADADESPGDTLPPFAHKGAVNPALNERTDPDATKPLRIEAQKALPAAKALVAAGLVTIDQVEQAAVEQAARGGRTIEIMVAHGWCTDAQVADALAKASGKKRLVDESLAVKDRALLKRLPQTYALARRLLPLALDAGTLVLAVADPWDQKVIDEVRDLVHALDVDVGVAGRAALTAATMKAFAELHGAQVAQSGPRVLLGIKDDQKAQQLGARLAQEGMQVEHVVDGVTARSILQTRCPDAVICTWDLPGVDGQGLLLAARHHEKTAELPVFIIGPRSDDDLMAKVLDLGADDYFGEPVRPDVVVAKLRRAINKGQGRPSMAPEPAPPPPSALPMKVPSPTSSAPVASIASDAFVGFDDMPDLPPEFDNVSAPEVPAMPTGVMGTLRQMSLPEIVQSLEMGRKTASVDIVPQDGEKGAIAFDTGSIRFAECGGLVGDQAFFALMRHKEGFFRIHYGDAPKSINIDAPTTFLLLEAMRLMDEEGA